MGSEEEDSEIFRHISHHKKRAFLAAYAENGNVKQAAKAAGIERRTHYNWRLSDPQYAEAFKQACVCASDNLEAVARKRAVAGWEEPVFYLGEQCGTVRKFSDTLLIFLLKGNNPAKFKDRTEITGKNDGPIRTQSIDLSKLTSEELAHLDRIQSKLAAEP